MKKYTVTKYKKTVGVIHKTLGSFKSALYTLRNSNNSKSANYLISRKGKVVGIVPPEHASWHAGNIYRPSQAFKKVALRNFWGNYVNPNLYSIGIEFEAFKDEDLTDIQIKKGREIFKKLGITKIITHKDIASYKPSMSKALALILKPMYELIKQIDQDEIFYIKDGKRYHIGGYKTLKAFDGVLWGMNNIKIVGTFKEQKAGTLLLDIGE